MTTRRPRLVRPATTTRRLTSDIMTACQSAAAMAVDLAGLEGKRRQEVLLSPALNRHVLKVAKELARKMQGTANACPECGFIKGHHAIGCSKAVPKKWGGSR